MSRCRWFHGFGAVGLLLGLVVLSAQSQPLNVLFIAVDDLRPTLGCYGDRLAQTPNLDRLARRGLQFNNAHCQQAVCGPSRLSLLSGRRPDTIQVWDLGTHFREAVPDCVSLPQFFKQRGYRTQSIGKIYHGAGKPSKDPPSWTVPPIYDYVREPTLRYALPVNLAGSGLKRAASERADVADNYYTDGRVADIAEATLTELAASGESFFLGVGFRKPHLPFCAPQKYWDRYERDAIPLPKADQHPIGAPEWATRSWRELEGYTDIPRDGHVSIEKMRELRHGYYACVSYVDAMIGRVLKRLEDVGLADRTVVCVWGDHGFHLGEQGLWAKANNYEWSTRVPLILALPNRMPRAGQTDALVELVDVYPSLVEACGFSVPEGLEGLSVLPLFDRPTQAWKKAVFMQYPRDYSGYRHQRHGEIMGYAMRTGRYRYVEWRDWASGQVLQREIYDRATDPLEGVNLLSGAAYPELVAQLAAQLHGGWRGALPSGRD